jgi:hypothetical protein
MARNGTTTAQRDHPGRWRRPLARPRRPLHLALLILLSAGLVVYSWVVANAAPFSRGALIGVLLPGAVLGAIALVRPPERIPPPDKLDMIGMSYWVICVAAFFEWEASAYKDNSWPWHPSFTNLIDPLMEPHLVKSAAILVWLLAGWALVRR